jgi:hypothetical protein
MLNNIFKLYVSLFVLVVFMSLDGLHGMDSNQERQDAALVDLVFSKTIELASSLIANETLVTYINPKLIELPFRSFYGNGCMPGMLPFDYLKRIHKYFNCPPASYVLALFYIENLILKTDDMYIFNNITFYRIFLAAILVATKFLQDKVSTLNYYAQVGGIEVSGLIDLERDFLQAIDFELLVSAEDFQDFITELRTGQVASTPPSSSLAQS